MAILEVLHYPDERLRTVAKSIDRITPDIQQLAADMLETMYDEHGVGLAATQVNQHIRMVVMDVSEERNQPYVLINPEIIEKSGQIDNEEGCLSVPDQRANVSRANEVTVKALDLNGEEQEIHAEGFFAICIQHELDHLLGKLYIDYLSPLKRKRLEDKLFKQYRQMSKQK